MGFPVTEALTPSLTGSLSPETRARWKERYRTIKKYGIRTAFSGLTTTSQKSFQIIYLY